MVQGISPQKMALYGTVPPFLDPRIPIDVRYKAHELYITNASSAVVDGQIPGAAFAEFKGSGSCLAFRR